MAAKRNLLEPAIDTSTQSAHARAQPRSALLLTAPFLIALLLLLGLSIAGIESLSAARAYVGGESNWSKAQKRAVSHLLRYASERDAADYRQFTPTSTSRLATGRRGRSWTGRNQM